MAKWTNGKRTRHITKGLLIAVPTRDPKIATHCPCTCPTTNRGWFWHAATGSVLLQDGWQQYLDGDTQKYWWWHEPSQDWFYEGQHCFFLLASGKGETYIKALADCRVNAIFDRQMGGFQSAHLPAST